jgi:hypothetical protein
VRLYVPQPGAWFKGSLLVFNPDRPDILIPATVKERMEAMLDYHRIKREIDRINQEKVLAAWFRMTIYRHK